MNDALDRFAKEVGPADPGREHGRLVYWMKRPRGGSLLLVLTPDELLARIATLVPPPRVHALRFHGVFAPNSKVRKRVVPATTADRSSCEPAEPAAAVASMPSTERFRDAQATYRIP